jgi:hypothetical protein
MPDRIVWTRTKFSSLIHRNCIKLTRPARKHASQGRRQATMTEAGGLGWPWCLSQLPGSDFSGRRDPVFPYFPFSRPHENIWSGFVSGERGGQTFRPPWLVLLFEISCFTNYFVGLRSGTGRRHAEDTSPRRNYMVHPRENGEFFSEVYQLTGYHCTDFLTQGSFGQLSVIPTVNIDAKSLLRWKVSPVPLH